MPSPIDSTWPTSATSASLPKLAICCLRIAEISAGRISMNTLSGNILHRELQPLQLAFDRSVNHARADFDDHTADQPRIDAHIDRDSASDAAAQLLIEGSELGFVQSLRRSHLCVDLAAPRRELREIGLDDRRNGEQPAVACDDREKVADQRR